MVNLLAFGMFRNLRVLLEATDGGWQDCLCIIIILYFNENSTLLGQSSDILPNWASAVKHCKQKKLSANSASDQPPLLRPCSIDRGCNTASPSIPFYDRRTIAITELAARPSSSERISRQNAPNDITGNTAHPPVIPINRPNRNLALLRLARKLQHDTKPTRTAQLGAQCLQATRHTAPNPPATTAPNLDLTRSPKTRAHALAPKNRDCRLRRPHGPHRHRARALPRMGPPHPQTLPQDQQDPCVGPAPVAARGRRHPVLVGDAENPPRESCRREDCLAVWRWC